MEPEEAPVKLEQLEQLEQFVFKPPIKLEQHEQGVLEWIAEPAEATIKLEQPEDSVPESEPAELRIKLEQPENPVPEAAPAQLKATEPAEVFIKLEQPEHSVPETASAQPKQDVPESSPEKPKAALVASPGASIRLKGLQSTPHLNGCLATIQSWTATASRWKVRLESGEVKGVKEDNIDVLSVPEGNAASSRSIGKARPRGLVRSNGLRPSELTSEQVPGPGSVDLNTLAMGALLNSGNGDELSSEAQLLSALAGATAVDASEVENSVIDRCDTANTLQQRRMELGQVDREFARLVSRREALRKRTKSASTESVDAPAAAKDIMLAEIHAMESRRQFLREEITELEQPRTGRSTSRSAGASSSMAEASPLKKQRKMPELPVQNPKFKKQELKQENTTLDLKVEPGTSGTAQSSSSSSAAYHIDVTQLVPKDSNKLKVSLPGSLSAMKKGDTISPSVNIWRRPFVKRKNKAPGDADAPQKVRREDDTSDRSYQRRQELLTKTARVASKALDAKQPVGADGEVVKDEQLPKLLPKVEERMVGSKLQDDVDVAEGLRCPRWLWEALYPYQHVCVRWLWDMHREKMGAILADEMGLGKTIQIAAYLAVLHHSGVLQRMCVQNTSLGTAAPSKTGGVLIVCPATLIPQWKNELHLWYPPLRVCVMHQVDERERKAAIEAASSQSGVLLTSYDTMRIELDSLLEASWVIVILDEGQKIRNPHCGTTIAAKRFSTPHRIILSGSPIQNRLQELWSLFDFICPGRLGTLPVFLEEFATPIECGNNTGANEAKVAAAYQCALALRELTIPCILRRTKAEVMDVLKLPPKQEQVLFCNLTQEQFVAYLNFLQTEMVTRAKNASHSRSCAGAAFYAISVLRKLCNHPDLLLKDLDPSLQPPDMWNPARSGKMAVLEKVCKVWHAEKHRVLIFCQTVMMLDIIQRWMTKEGYTHLRMDGKTAVKSRLAYVDEFNKNEAYFAMILTTRVGGVGLNIIGADRVVIFDPDWNPMTDVQARERAWRIGQTRDVAVYRLVLTGTIEEKIYQRQVYKHFLAQKVLNDPRQRQFFKWNDLADLFDVPAPPPNCDPAEMREMKQKYKQLFAGMAHDHDEYDEQQVETTHVMRSITNLPMKDQHVPGDDAAAEHNSILQSLYDSNGIKASFNHDKVEQPLLDRKIVRDGANMIAERALSAIARSSRERGSHHISEPTWTGQVGRAGATAKQEKKMKVKHEFGAAESKVRTQHLSGTVSSKDILQGLRQLTAIREMASQRGATQAQDAARMGLVSAAQKSSTPVPGDVGLPIELHDSDRKIAEMILESFLDPKFAGSSHSLTTGNVLEHLARRVADHHGDLFKTLLKQLCQLSKPAHPSQPGIWTLRAEFWPVKGKKVKEEQ